MRHDEYVRERRARVRALQAAEPEPYDWAGALWFGVKVLLWVVLTLAGGVGLAWMPGAGLDWLERILP